MFCTFCYHGDCHVERAKCACASVCVMCVCVRVSSRAISQAQILKLFSEETRVKRETPTTPFCSSSPPFFSPLLIFLILHQFFWPSSRSFIPIFLEMPHSLALSRSPPLSCRPSPSAPAASPPPPNTLLHPMVTVRRWSEEETDRPWELDLQRPI